MCFTENRWRAWYIVGIWQGLAIALHNRSRGRGISLMETPLRSEAAPWACLLCLGSPFAKHLECTHCLARTSSVLDKTGKITIALSTLPQATTFLFILVITTNPVFIQIFLSMPQSWNIISSTIRISFEITLNSQEVSWTHEWSISQSRMITHRTSLRFFSPLLCWLC